MEKQYKLYDRVSKDSLKSPTFKKWFKRILCAVCIISLALQLTFCCLPMQASAQEDDSIVGTWYIPSSALPPSSQITCTCDAIATFGSWSVVRMFNLRSSSYGMIAFSNNSATNFSVLENGAYVNGWDGYITFNSEPSAFSYGSYSMLLDWLNTYAVKQVTQVYDFTGEYRLFNEQLTNLSFSQVGTVTQSYAFDFNIWGGYNADYFHVQADGSSVDISYAFTDEGSGGIKTVYRQLLRDGEIVGTWLVPRARLIYFQSNPEDPTFQQWLLDNTVLIDESMIDSVYSFGYDNGYNDGWTNSAIGDTLKAPVEALNNIILLDIAGVTITLGGVIFTMVVLSIMLIFLKKYAGG